MIFYNIYTHTQRSIVSPLYDRMAYLARDDHPIFDDNLGFCPSLFLVTDKNEIAPSTGENHYVSYLSTGY